MAAVGGGIEAEAVQAQGCPTHGTGPFYAQAGLARRARLCWLFSVRLLRSDPRYLLHDLMREQHVGVHRQAGVAQQQCGPVLQVWKAL